MTTLNPKKKSWLQTLVDALGPALAPTSTSTTAADSTAEVQGEQFIAAFLDRYGFIFGELQLDTLRWTIAQHARIAPEHREFFERMALLLELSQGLAALYNRTPSATRTLVEFATLLGITYGEREIAHELGRWLDGLDDYEQLPREVEKLLERLAKQLAQLDETWQDPLYVKTLRRSFRYADTRLFGRLAAEYYRRGYYDQLEMIALHLDRIAEKRVLFQCTIGMVWADGELTYDEKGLIKHLLQLSNLPTQVTEELLAALNQHRPLPVLVDELRDDETRRFVFRQVVLASLADGVQEDHEARYIAELAEKLGISADESEALQLEMLQYFEQNASVFDHSVWGVLTRFRQRMGDRVTRVVKRNVDRIMTEVRQTGELSSLLAKATHSKLSAEEQRKVREQLLDIAKTIPALAIFVIPGGSVVFAVLCKVLPFNLLPSAFADDDADIVTTAPTDSPPAPHDKS